jgi:large subunit ribosomal protein L9
VAQAILLKDVENLGEAGTAVDVSNGYLRNYLIPRKLAQPATKGALLSKTVLTITHRAGEDGKLYGSVTTKEIAEAISEARGLRVDRKKIRLDQPIHETGTYLVEIEVAGGQTAKVKTIVAEQR